MNLKHEFEIKASLDQAWSVLLDVPRLAPCVPGVELTDIIDDKHYKGTASIRVGPVALKFAGVAEIADIDNEGKSAVLKAKGADNKGRGQAQADVVFTLSDAGEGTTKVVVETDLSLTGTIAQYGRAAGLIDQIAKQLIADFVKNLEGELQQEQVEVLQDQAAPTSAQVAPRQAGKPISGFGLLLRAISAMIKGWFGK